MKRTLIFIIVLQIVVCNMLNIIAASKGCFFLSG